jgi:Na+/H+ antiporter NhaD/arsenite permease-like protein
MNKITDKLVDKYLKIFLIVIFIIYIPLSAVIDNINSKTQSVILVPITNIVLLFGALQYCIFLFLPKSDSKKTKTLQKKYVINSEIMSIFTIVTMFVIFFINHPTNFVKLRETILLRAGKGSGPLFLLICFLGYVAAYAYSRAIENKIELVELVNELNSGKKGIPRKNIDLN